MHILGNRKSFKFIILFGIFILAAIIKINLPIHLPIYLNFVLMLLPILYFYGYINSASTIEYNDTNILVNKLFRPPSSYSWQDIYHVREENIWGTFKFSGKYGSDLFAFGRDLARIEPFFKLLAKTRPNLLKVTVGDKVRASFSSHLSANGILIAMGIIIILVEPNAAILGIPIIAVAIYLIINFPYVLILGSNKLVLKFVLKTIEFPVINIKSIELDRMYPTNTQNSYFVFIKFNKGCLYTISLPGHSKYLLYLQLRSWLDTVNSNHLNQ